MKPAVSYKPPTLALDLTFQQVPGLMNGTGHRIPCDFWLSFANEFRQTS